MEDSGKIMKRSEFKNDAELNNRYKQTIVVFFCFFFTEITELFITYFKSYEGGSKVYRIK